MGLENVSWQGCQGSEVERCQAMVENGILKPEILRGEQLLPPLSFCPSRMQDGIRSQRYSGGKGHWRENGGCEVVGSLRMIISKRVSQGISSAGMGKNDCAQTSGSGTVW